MGGSLRRSWCWEPVASLSCGLNTPSCQATLASARANLGPDATILFTNLRHQRHKRVLKAMFQETWRTCIKQNSAKMRGPSGRSAGLRLGIEEGKPGEPLRCACTRMVASARRANRLSCSGRFSCLAAPLAPQALAGHHEKSSRRQVWSPTQ